MQTINYLELNLANQCLGVLKPTWNQPAYQWYPFSTLTDCFLKSAQSHSVEDCGCVKNHCAPETKAQGQVKSLPKISQLVSE